MVLLCFAFLVSMGCHDHILTKCEIYCVSLSVAYVFLLSLSWMPSKVTPFSGSFAFISDNVCYWSSLSYSFTLRHGILHKPSASVKFWPKSFHKSNVIFDIFTKQIMPDFWHDKLSSQGIQINRIQDSVANHFKAFTALYSPCTLCNKNNFTFSFVENLKPFFVRSVKSAL